MSSASDSMIEKLLCCICMDVLNDPVSTSCGHNFCRICLNTYWENNPYCRCPYCNKTFTQRPDLNINTALREVVVHFMEKTAEKPEVLCDICDEVKLKAVKSCLVCQSSYCETHLGRHLTVTGLQKHKLINPVNNLQDYICQKHERPLELFCRDDRAHVCLICTVTDHKNHNTVTLEEEINQEKHLKSWKHQQKSPFDFHLMPLLVEKVKSRMWFLVVPVGISLLMFFYFSSSTECEILSVGKLSEAELKRMQKYAVDVTLDPDTANPYLTLSDDNKQVRYGDIKLKLPDNPNRFDYYLSVLGKQGFSSGRFYYEVQVKGKTNWILGVARESVNIKGVTQVTPADGFWTVTLWTENEYKANTGPDIFLCLKVSPHKVGVFVDYEEGLVSFYDVESRSHIYSFTDQSFNEKLYPYFNPCTADKDINSSPLIITPVNNNK
ncbi:E3 ubiquitin-protein ligase TRIM39-like [Paramisgurnus dabryanus]|uniref:E3 ubiquitin-protein ligase TRIM39-like n=1 Tax=Paramisgurnus dabryanus TaxID=90735 RepID=UPI0031F4643E